YARKNDHKAGLSVVNRANTPQTFEANVAGFLPDGITLQDQLFDTYSSIVSGGKVSITVPARSGYMMVSTQELTQVPQVANLQAVGGNAQVALTWGPVSGAASYNIYRAPIEGGTLERLGTVTSAVYTDAHVINGLKYYYAVTAQMGTNESMITDMVATTPYYPIQSVNVVKEANAMTVGVGIQTSAIDVNMAISGLTDDPSLAGKEAANLVSKLAFYKVENGKSAATETKLRYKQDVSGGLKQYTATFEPTEAGTYQYYAKVSTDNGETFTESAEKSIVFSADTSDTVAPSDPVLDDITVESNRATLNWSLSGTDVKGIEIYRKTTNSSYAKIAVLAKDRTSYIDFAVSNDSLYTYKVIAFDQAYNRASSVEKSVTPKLVMIDVTIQLHLPSYTPTSDDIYLAGSVNGWNAAGWKMTVPSGATDRSVVETTFKMMAGKSIDYKYTRGAWSSEAFTSHSRIVNDLTDAGNWAYSSTDTNMHLTVANQGNSKMLINDYVLRWVDMPMMISLPRTSYGSDISYTTAENSFNLQSVVPFGVSYTINGKPIPTSAMDATGHVNITNIPLIVGQNIFTLHIEPTAETLAQPWYTDQGRKSQATKDITMTITRTGDTEPTPTPTPTPSPVTHSNPSPTPTPPLVPTPTPNVTPLPTPAAVMVEEKDMHVDNNKNFVVETNAASIELPSDLNRIIGKNNLIVKNKDVTIALPHEVLQAIQALVPAASLKDAHISLQAIKVSSENSDALLKKTNGAKPNEQVKAAGDIFEFKLSITTSDGQTQTLSKFAKPITLTLKVNPNADQALLGVYYISDDGKLEYVGGKLIGNELQASIYHFSKYAVLEMNKTFTDVEESHWALQAIKEAAAKHIVEGVNETEFVPAGQVTRAQFSAMIVRALGLTAVGAAKFKDVSSEQWYASAVAAASEYGIINGRSEEAFAPDDKITREEMTAMILRAYEWLTGMSQHSAAPSSFTDRTAVSDWALAYVDAASDLKLVQGSEGAFMPAANATRAEAVAIIMNMLHK
ncbi:MAG: alpha amylase catalytic region, partial [Bacilli bacterium]|nr:alpha amylase catalytic region [Bacilli bacterium]